MWILLQTYFKWYSQEEKGEEHPDRISTSETGPLADTVELRVVWNGFCEWTNPRANTDLVDSMTSTGTQDPVG